jgi:hypothetical protein
MESELMDLRLAHRLDRPDDGRVEVARAEVEHCGMLAHRRAMPRIR